MEARLIKKGTFSSQCNPVKCQESTVKPTQDKAVWTMKCGLVPLQVTNRAHADCKSILVTRIQKKRQLVNFGHQQPLRLSWLHM